MKTSAASKWFQASLHVLVQPALLRSLAWWRTSSAGLKLGCSEPSTTLVLELMGFPRSWSMSRDRQNGAEQMAQLAEALPGKHEVLGSDPQHPSKQCKVHLSVQSWGAQRLKIPEACW